MSRKQPLSIAFAAWLAISAAPLLAAQSPRVVAPSVPRSSQASVASAAPVAQFWDHLTRLWAAVGCGLDPNGAKCATDPAGTSPTAVIPTTPSDLGCGLDPNG